MQKSDRQRNRWVPENLGWLDRLIRFMIGSIIIGSVFTTLYYFTDPVWATEGRDPRGWAVYPMLISVYFYLTGILGSDPIYGLFHIRSCGGSPRNPCGSFPFEVEAALGKEPKPKSDIAHKLSESQYDDELGHRKS
jgi:Inner membrane protein YgaP-like, transmembrane domain